MAPRSIFRASCSKPLQYGIKPTAANIDYDQVERLAQEHRPKMVVAGFSAYSRVIDWARFRAIADSVGAYFFVDMAHVAGLVACGPLSESGAVRGCGHHDDAQDAARPARRPDSGAAARRPAQEIQFDGISGHAGRPADACDRGQGGGLSRGAAAGIQESIPRRWSPMRAP